MSREEMQEFFAERLRRTSLHELGIGTYQISRGLAYILAGSRPRHNAEIIATMLMEFADQDRENRA